MTLQISGFCLVLYRWFVKNFAHIAAPLQRLTEKGKQWMWPECEQAFQVQLITALILEFPTFSIHSFWTVMPVGMA